MNTRSSSRRVHFQQPFRLSGMAMPHPPGSFELRVAETPTDTAVEAYHLTLTLLLASGAHTVTAAELERALAADRHYTAILAAVS